MPKMQKMKVMYTKKYKTSYKGDFDAPLNQQIVEQNQNIPEVDHNKIQQQMQDAARLAKKEQLVQDSSLSNG